MATEKSKPSEKIKNYGANKDLQVKCAELYTQVVTGFREEKKNQNESIEECWDIYNCALGDNQQYDGDSQVYEPIVHDALEARRKRFTGMTFPNVGNNLEVISEQGDVPQATMSVLQRYIKDTNLRSVASTLYLNGDIEGQWSVMPGWRKKERRITRKVQKSIPGTSEEYSDVQQEVIVDEGPEVTVIAAQDLWVFPPTVSDIQDAEVVAVSLRLTMDAVDDYVKDGTFLKNSVDVMTTDSGEDNSIWAAKARTAEAGIRMKAGQKFVLVYMVFTRLKIEGRKRPAIVYLAGPDNVLGIILNPYWNQKIPVISEPVDKVAGSFWGKSKVQTVAPLQYQLNDINNMGMDSAMYSLMPVVMTDPLKNPQYSSMVMAMAAIWPTNPNDTQIVSMPPLYQHALTLKQAIKGQIMESMEVNEVMLGAAPAGRKNAQSIGAQNAEAMATIGDVVKRFELGIMNRLMEWFYDLDLQFRDDDLAVLVDGAHGVQSIVEKIPPQQVGYRYWFKWLGADKAMGAQNNQQLISWMNVLRGLPPQVLNGRRLDLGPMIDFLNEAICGPTMAQNVLIDERHRISIPPDMENEFMINNIPAIVCPLDNDVEHIQVHQQGAQITGDPTGQFRLHIQDHITAIQEKQSKPPAQGYPGIPGGVSGPGGPPGVAGTPRPGAVPEGPRAGQNPPGAIHADQMQDPQAGMRG
ncbi:MAG: hypothetical protein V4621_08015 [Pseudomonadota bacterium]